MRGGPACFGGSGLSLLKEETMVKAWLRDDVETPEWRDRPTQFDPVVSEHADDQVPGQPVVETTVNPMLTVRVRFRTGYDDDSNPVFDWTTVAESRAIVWTKRDEFDSEAGFTKVTATAEMRYEGDVQVTESAAVQSEDGTNWRVTAVRQSPGRLGFDLERIAG